MSDATEAFVNWSTEIGVDSKEYNEMGSDEFFMAGYQFRESEIQLMRDYLKVQVDATRVIIEQRNQAWEQIEAMRHEIAQLTDQTQALKNMVLPKSIYHYFHKSNTESTPSK